MFDSFVDRNAVCPKCKFRQDNWQTKDLQALGEGWNVGDFFQYHYLRPLRKREKEKIIREDKGIVNAEGQLIAPLFAHGKYMSEQPIISNGEINVHTSCDNRKCGAWLEALAVIRKGKFVGIRAIRPRKLSNTTRPKTTRLKGVGEGVLATVFGGSIAKVLDQAMYVGDMEQTIPTFVESTGLSFETTQKAVLKLNKLGLVKRSRRIGNTHPYRFDAGNDLRELISWAEKVKVNRIRD